MSGICYQLGKLIAPKYRRNKWLWHSLFGSSRETVQAEYDVGRELANEICLKAGIDPDSNALDMLNGVLNKLSSSVKNTQYRFKIMVLKSGDPNAYAVPGGFIFITRSLLDVCRWDRESVAFILAHEMGHILKGHAMERLMTNSAFKGLFAMAPKGGTVGRWIRQTGFSALESAYSRDREYEADKIGLEIVKASGFDLRAADRILIRLAAIQHNSRNSDALSKYFSTHPPFPERIVHFRHLLNKCP
jgi:Zn-dependent protease with chaperone function